tara:strand:+ start:12681 stop:13091 length:411 start_codon:yes stop_codon:yes gene_type:complete
MTQCKCKECKGKFETEAPSRIKEPICAECISKDSNKPKFVGIPKDFAKVQRQLRKEFGVCPGPNCNNALIPLQSFKADGKMYCQGCYRKIMEPRWKSSSNESKDSILTVNENVKDDLASNMIYGNEKNGLRPTQEV